MPVTTLDRQTALVVIDLQKGIAVPPRAHPVDGVLQNTRRLLDIFRRKSLPVALVNVNGGAPGRTEQPPRDFSQLPPDWSELVPELDAQPGDHRVTKRTWGAFTNTDLDAWLKSQGVTQIVLCGIATSLGVESTARQAWELGYHVTLAVDAMTDMSVEAHDNSVARIFPRLGETGSTQDILDLLA